MMLVDVDLPAWRKTEMQNLTFLSFSCVLQSTISINTNNTVSGVTVSAISLVIPVSTSFVPTFVTVFVLFC